MRCTTPTLETTVVMNAVVPAAFTEICRPVQENANAEFHPLHMTWVVVSDPSGNRRLRMHWGAN